MTRLNYLCSDKVQILEVIMKMLVFATVICVILGVCGANPAGPGGIPDDGKSYYFLTWKEFCFI